MTALDEYLSRGRQYALDAEAAVGDTPYDEVVDDGRLRAGWVPIAGAMRRLSGPYLSRLAGDVARLIEDDGATYNRIQTHTDASGSVVSEAVTEPWRLDPVPLVVQPGEWELLEAGLAQRARLLDAVVRDIYGAQTLLADGSIPPPIVMGHGGYVRYAHGIEVPGAHQLVMSATDLGRAPGGQWTVMSDRTQAPSGAAYAMENRRVMSRLFPEIYRDVQIARLLPFFNALRTGIEATAPPRTDSPRVVVLSPGAQSETAFDQAYLASLLGYPLVEGSDLTMRDGRVWLRSMGELDPVDVIIRRVDATWTDPLFLRGSSRLGVPGLVDAARRGTVSILNGLGSGVLENPALLGLLPSLSRRLLDEDLLLPSVSTYWCGNDAERSHVLANLDSLVLRPIDRERGPTVYGGDLSSAERDEWRARIEAAPYDYTGQELLALSQLPTTRDDVLEPRPVLLRGFVASSGEGYAVLPGGLARVPDVPASAGGSMLGMFVGDPPPHISKDTWVLLGDDIDPAATGWLHDGPSAPPSDPFLAMTPRMLSDLFWIGRYSARAEDLVRLVLSVREITGDLHSSPRGGAGDALRTMRQAMTQVSMTYPGFLSEDVSPLREIHSLMVDAQRTGTVAQSIARLGGALQEVRDQFSTDVWMVMAEIERALAQLRRTPQDLGSQLVHTAEVVHRGMLGMSGIFYDNMIHDPGWHLLEAGRAIERANSLIALLRSTLGVRTTPYADSQVIDAVLKATESIVTYRRRYRGRAHIDGVLQLLMLDENNPRSIAFALHKLAIDIPTFDPEPGGPIQQALEGASSILRGVDVVQLASPDDDGVRTELEELLSQLYDAIGEISQQIYRRHLRPPADQQPIFEGTARVESPR
ncbi:hypothetical protein EK0264_05410 [Epidermidibacterium keratini]|uniref:DUF403 domain-containing protein n=1 Tax=Epidermidibacterium keratini TaxID=1891644 RepID=A0A7L4YKJ6_9ACTN|nr:circularly permuted type 2 ATP-grasp protein [Epidermidibacterium keratini]QHB99770.1 hypothetical protein EK0264_05410 [Epidermidibacterium keratini]